MHEVSDHDVMRWLFGEASRMFVAAQTTGDRELRREKVTCFTRLLVQFRCSDRAASR